MASAKRVHMMVPDGQGNNPLHFAALADTSEVALFLLQQTRGLLTDDIRLVDSRNELGETPLLRTMSTGNFLVAKTLVEEGSDPLVTDLQGNSVFTKLAKTGNIWCLNFMYHMICSLHGPQVALELMCTVDNEAHSPLDWAADHGDINVIEFFIRKGMNPYRHDHMNRSPLYWAVKANQLEAARFLVMIGCDPHQKDAIGQSPYAMALASQSKDMLQALRAPNHNLDLVRQLSEQEGVSMTHVRDKIPRLYTATTRRSFGIYHRNVSSVIMALVFFLCFAVLWLCVVVIPSYVVIAIVALGALLLRRYDRHLRGKPSSLNYLLPIAVMSTPSSRSTHSASVSAPAPSPAPAPGDGFLFNPLVPASQSWTSLCWESVEKVTQDVMVAKEAGLGLFLASWLFYALYLLTAYYYLQDAERDASHDTTNTLISWQDITYRNPFHVYGGLGSADVMRYVLFVAMGSAVGALGLWLWLVFGPGHNPGIIDHRETDFDEILQQSLFTLAPPSAKLYCHTTFVKKPLRSKFCRHTGAVIARFDHYCIWLNTTIGFANHRLFLFFLLELLFTTSLGAFLTSYGLSVGLSTTSGCLAVGMLFNREYFFTFTLTVFLGLASLVILALVVDQVGNLLGNLTTNEKINRHKYPWLEVVDGRHCQSKFDRGMWSNLLEFIRIGGYDLDYMRCYTLSPELTQENMSMRHMSAHGEDATAAPTPGSPTSPTSPAALSNVPLNPNPMAQSPSPSHSHKLHQGQTYDALAEQEMYGPSNGGPAASVMTTNNLLYSSNNNSSRSPTAPSRPARNRGTQRNRSVSSGPPSIDLEMTMQTKLRTDSVDSYDTNNTSDFV